jgi:hypothetical protein
MKSYVNFFIQKLEQFITAGMQYQEALEKLKPEYDKASPMQQKEIRNSVATLIGVKYREVPTLIEKGANKGTLGLRLFSKKLFSLTKKLQKAEPMRLLCGLVFCQSCFITH